MTWLNVKYVPTVPCEIFGSIFTENVHLAFCIHLWFTWWLNDIWHATVRMVLLDFFVRWRVCCRQFYILVFPGWKQCPSVTKRVLNFFRPMTAPRTGFRPHLSKHCWKTSSTRWQLKFAWFTFVYRFTVDGRSITVLFCVTWQIYSVSQKIHLHTFSRFWAKWLGIQHDHTNPQ